SVAVDELDLPARMHDGERGRHEGVRRAEDGLAPEAQVLEHRERTAGPGRERDGGKAVPVLPRGLELDGQLALGPALLVEDPIPEVAKPGSISVIEADRK